MHMDTPGSEAVSRFVFDWVSVTVVEVSKVPLHVNFVEPKRFKQTTNETVDPHRGFWYDLIFWKEPLCYFDKVFKRLLVSRHGAGIQSGGVPVTIRYLKRQRGQRMGRRVIQNENWLKMTTSHYSSSHI